MEVGVDIIEIERIKISIERFGTRFLERVFTEKEIAYCEAHVTSKYKHYAVRFAAKEAVAKSLGTGISNSINWTDIEVTNRISNDTTQSGKPEITLYNNAKNVAKKQKVKRISISLSHCNNYAVATAVAEK